MNMKRDRRRAFVATSSLQYRFLAMVLIYCFVIVAFFAVAVFVPDLMEMEDQSLSLVARGNAAARLLTKHSWVWPAVFSLILLLGMHSFFAFQKIMGPLYRFRCALEELANGNLRHRVRIRRNDFLHAEEQIFDGMIKSLNAKIACLKDAAEEARISLGRLEQAVNTGTPLNETQLNQLTLHRQHLDRLATGIQVFRLQEEGEKETEGSPIFQGESSVGCCSQIIHGEQKWDTVA
jgi:methyl-accepting chemotaxis protein